MTMRSRRNAFAGRSFKRAIGCNVVTRLNVGARVGITCNVQELRLSPKMSKELTSFANSAHAIMMKRRANHLTKNSNPTE